MRVHAPKNMIVIPPTIWCSWRVRNTPRTTKPRAPTSRRNRCAGADRATTRSMGLLRAVVVHDRGRGRPGIVPSEMELLCGEVGRAICVDRFFCRQAFLPACQRAGECGGEAAVDPDG